MVASVCRDEGFAGRAEKTGLVTRQGLEEAARAWLAWAEEPDAFFARAWVEAVAHAE